MRSATISAIFVGLLMAFARAHAADIPGTKDPEGLKRFEGSEIIHQGGRPYDRYSVLGLTLGSFTVSKTVEGALTRTAYLVPPGHTSLELFRNYESMLADAGFNVTFKTPSETPGVFNSVDSTYVATVDKYWLNMGRAVWYLAANATKDGRDITVTVLTFEVPNNVTWKEGAIPVSAKAGQVIVIVDTAVAKAVQVKMVEVKATDMADALATKGSVDIYGILFDTDKTDIKPESSKTLNEVAMLLKIDRSLKLEIAGHTDNTGTPEHNATLSDGRAKAVVDALVKTYGIDAARLQANGYGETKPVAPNTDEAGRAKNRRVELRKI